MKKMSLTQVSRDEMKESKAGRLPGGGCYCSCSCWEVSDGMVDGQSNYGFFSLTGGLPAEKENWNNIMR